MIRLMDTKLLPFNSKIEKTCQENRMAWNQSISQYNIMADPREERVDTKALHDYVTPTIIDTIFGIKRLPITLRSSQPLSRWFKLINLVAL